MPKPNNEWERMSKAISYRPEIDGLRAIAVLPVMLFHAGLGPFPGGYVGVDVFFVISGFLITSIIYNEVVAGQFTYAKFYERRARRIFPALYFIVLLTLLPAWFLLVPQDFKDYSENIIGVVTFFSNVILWIQSGYFDQSAELKPLLHTWSLAVEEQYYVFFPIILMLFHRFWRKHLILLLALLMVGSLLLSQWGAVNKPTANYYLLPTRAWELFIGSLVALVLTTRKWQDLEGQLSKYAQALSLSGFALIVFAVFAFDSETLFPSFWALIPTLGTALVILFSTEKTLIHKLLSTRLLVGVGLISYSAYLWHQPVYAFARHQNMFEETHLLMTFAFLLSLLGAYLSWRYVERPFRNRKKISTKQVWVMSFAGGLLLASFGVVGTVKNGFEGRFTLTPPLSESNFDLPTRSNGWCFYSVDTNSSLSVGKEGFQCPLGDTDSATKVLLIGDSFAAMYEPFWDLVGKESALSVNAVTTNWCHPSLEKSFWWKGETPAKEQCLLNRDYLKSAVDQYDVIVLSGVWSKLDHVGMLGEVTSLIQTLTQTHNKKVVVMAQPHHLERTSVMRAVYTNGALEVRDTDQGVAQLNQSFKDLSLTNDNLFFIGRDAMFDEQGPFGPLLSADGVPYSWDGGHLSIYGSLEAGKNFIKSDQFKALKTFSR